MHKFFNIAATYELQDDAEWNSIENGGGGIIVEFSQKFLAF